MMRVFIIQYAFSIFNSAIPILKSPLDNIAIFVAQIENHNYIYMYNILYNIIIIIYRCHFYNGVKYIKHNNIDDRIVFTMFL